MNRERDEELRDVLDKLGNDGPSPDFETIWRRAEVNTRSGKERDAGAWRWLAGPVVAVVSAAVVAVIVLFPGGGGMGETSGGFASLDGLSTPDAGAFLSEDVFAGIDAVDLGSWTDDSGLTGAPGERLFVGETDFIINIQIPSWDRDEERNM